MRDRFEESDRVTDCIIVRERSGKGRETRNVGKRVKETHRNR